MTKYCCKQMDQSVSTPWPGGVHAHLSSDVWVEYGSYGWYPGATGPGFYEVIHHGEDLSCPLPGGGYADILEYCKVMTCPFCGESLEWKPANEVSER